MYLKNSYGNFEATPPQWFPVAAVHCWSDFYQWLKIKNSLWLAISAIQVTWHLSIPISSIVQFKPFTHVRNCNTCMNVTGRWNDISYLLPSLSREVLPTAAKGFRFTSATAHKTQLQTAWGGSHNTCHLFCPSHLRQKGKFQKAEDEREVGS